MRVVPEEGRDWLVLRAGERPLDEGFRLLLGVLRRKVESET